MGIAANKEDLYENEEVDDNEGKMLAKELGAIFQKTSAKESTGVEDLFIKLGKKIIDSSSLLNKENNFEEVERKKNKSEKLDKNKINNNNTQKKDCC